jgi:hypothetical protein
MFTSDQSEKVNQILHHNGIKFVRDRGLDNVTTYILDLENNSDKVSDLRENFEIPINLTEINYIPD